MCIKCYPFRRNRCQAAGFSGKMSNFVQNFTDMELATIIDAFISGDWGNESSSQETPNAVYCVRGADIVPIISTDYSKIPLRYVSDKTIKTKLLQAGDIVVEKSGGSPTQSTGRVVYISEELIKAKGGHVVCSNFCTAVRVKPNWNPYFVYQYWQFVYNAGVFFNFEGKTSGLRNLQLDNALTSIDIAPYTECEQNRIASTLLALEKKIAVNRAINHNLRASRAQSQAAA